MRWQGDQESENVEDQRGSSSSRGPMMVTGGVGTVVVVVIALLLGADPIALLQQINNQDRQAVPPAGRRQLPSRSQKTSNSNILLVSF